MLTDAELADLDAYLSARAEVTPEISGDRSPVIHDIDLGSRGHRRLMEPTITALLAEVRSLRAQREAVLALHSEEVRYTHPSWAEEYSWETTREMWESIYSAPVDASGEYTVDPDGYDADDLADEQLDAWFKREGGTTFSVCAECARIEVEDRMERGCYGPDVEWPCATVRAMGVTE